VIRLWRPVHCLQALRDDRSGMALIEFALIIPLFLIMGLWGIELSNYAYRTMRVGQVAAQIADNASRIGDYSKLENRKIYESDIDDLLIGANLQAGKGMDLFNRGRVIVSSLEVNTTGKQWIHWQRCVGKKVVTPLYGKENDVRAFGMGPAGGEVSAFDKEAVMFVELHYDYQPLISSAFVGTPTITSIASFTVRASRDLAEIYQTTPASPKMVCTKNTNTIA
jgi:hypothetical protein